MSGMHKYTWADVQSRPAAELKPGDIFVTPGRGTAYSTSMDGTEVHGNGWQELDGIAWTVSGWDNDKVTASSPDARDVTGSVPPGKHVLVVKKAK